MKFPMYSFNDSKSGRFSDPYRETNEATALRTFAEAINNNEHFRFSPGDYSLYHVGDFDTENGKIVPIDPVEFVCNGASVFNEK